MGFGGALVPGLAAGDVVLGETFWHYDPDTRELVAIQAPPPPRPLRQILHALNQAGLNAVTGSLVTTSRIIDKGSEGKPLSSLSQPVLDMETSVLAEVSAPRALPFLSLRAITDTASQEIPEFLREVGDPEATVGPRKALKWLAGDWWRAKELVTLWRWSHCAARSLSKALAILVPLLFDS
jgi:nucleoside phosphorylase